MISRILTASLYGLDGKMISVETDITRGLPCYNVIGLGDTVIRESGPRIRAAIENSGITYPRMRITVNLSPASYPKEGSHFDLPLALGILSAAGTITKTGEKRAFFGELSMNGDVVPVKGILPLVLCAAEAGVSEVFVPAANASEAALAGCMDVYPVYSLRQAQEYLAGARKTEIYNSKKRNVHMVKKQFDGSAAGGSRVMVHKDEYEDFSDVAGQENVKRAMVISAAGGHGLMMIGSPGAGKTMLAKRMPGILPPMTKKEMLDVTKIYSVAGLLNEELPMITERPFRSVSYDITRSALLGGGVRPVPGEFSLAHHGVLFMDEMPLFSKNVIESLRRPLEDRQVIIKRHGGSAKFPGDVILVAAANPCPCGHAGDQLKECTCTAAQIAAYERKISDMILDRIDMHVNVDRIKYEEIGIGSPMSTSVMRQQVIKARKRQEKRYGNAVFTNAHITQNQIKKYCRLDNDGEKLMHEAYEKIPLSMRTYVKTLCIARTIADIDESDDICFRHLAEALQYRSGIKEER